MPRHNEHRFSRRDANHLELARVYESLGCSVFDLSHVGFGFPDTAVGCAGPYGRCTDLVEIKTEDGVPTPAQVRFNRDWRGKPAVVVRSTADVIAHVKAMRERKP